MPGTALHLPTRDVVREFYAAHPDFHIDGRDRVRLTVRVNEQGVLTRDDHILLEAFNAAPNGVLDRASLRDVCVASGMNQNTFERLMGRSPLLESPSHNLWRLRGAGGRTRARFVHAASSPSMA